MPAKKVLIVDDEIINIYLLANFLAPSYDIIVSTSGKEALDKTLEQFPNLILLDIMMPDLDGYTVCKKLKENNITTNIPIIFVSALGSKSDIEKGYDVGANDYIVKPIQPEAFLQTVGNYL